MDDYLKGFNDGYNKAMEKIGVPKFVLKMDKRELAEIIYQDVTELQEIEKNTKQRFE